MSRLKTALGGRLPPLLLAALLTVLISTLLQDALHNIESRVNDLSWQWMSEQQYERRLIVIDIDEASIARYGAWPWSRTQLATLSRRAAEQGVALQIFDMLFPQPKEGDEQLLLALQQTPTVLGQILAIDADQPVAIGLLQGGERTPQCKPQPPAKLLQANASIGNAAPFQKIAAGHITPSISEDGAVRKVPALICHQQRAYPALVFAALAKGVESEPHFRLEEGNGWLDPAYWLTHQALPGVAVPLDRQGQMVVPWWLSRQAIISVSALDLIEGNVSPDLLQGAWALIGATAFGIGDSVPTPQGGAVDGVEIHLQLLSALLDGTVPWQPQGALPLQWSWIIVLALLLGFAGRAHGRWKSYGTPLLGLLLIALTLFGYIKGLQMGYLQLPWGIALLYTLLAVMLITSYEYALSRKENQRLYQNLTSYLPAHAARKIAQHGPNSEIDAQHEELLILVADLRNFSSWCDQLPAQQVAAILHTFFTEVTQLIHQHGGTTEEYVGDAVMGVWRNRDNNQAALQVAQQITAMGEALFGEETGIDQLPPLAIGVGIEFGEVLTGSFGPARRRVHTIIGRTVTASIRLQEMTADLAYPVLIGENAAKQWQGKVKMESLDKFMLSGIQQPQELFIPLED